MGRDQGPVSGPRKIRAERALRSQRRACEKRSAARRRRHAGRLSAGFRRLRNEMSQDIFEITREPIDKLGLEKRLLTGGAGAVVTFDGVVRDNTRGRRVVSLQYEAYEPMAVKEMRRIGGEIRERWPDVERVGIVHRFGPLAISESSVVIVVTSPHRRVAFEACRYAIDRLKQTVPIWKKEIFEDGEEWVEGQAPEISQ